MKKTLESLKKQIEEEPLQVVAAFSFATLAVARLFKARANMRYSKTWQKEIKRRDRMTK